MKPRVLFNGDVAEPLMRLRVRKAIRTALAAEGVTVPCEVNVLFTDGAGIRELNRALRNVDEETDVLSFPAFAFTAGAFSAGDGERDPDTGLLPLGDIALNLDRVRAQGAEYGHGTRRELLYLTVHSVLHLLGYDHMDEGAEKREMRRREEEIVKEFML